MAKDDTILGLDAPAVARALGIVRLGIGVSMTVAPGWAGRIWIGEHADGPGTRVFARSIGVRDVLLASRSLVAGREGESRARWMRYEALVDAGDAVATTIAARHLTPGRRIAMPLIAAGYAALTWWASPRVD